MLGGRESVDPQYVLESSDVALNQDEVEKSALDKEIFEASKKVRSEASSGTSNFQDHSHQIPIQMMTILLFQDHYFSNPSHQVGSKERRLPQNVLRPTTNAKKGKAHQQIAYKMRPMQPSLSLNRAKKRTSSLWPK